MKKKNLVLYSLLLAVAASFEMCKKDDEHPIPVIEKITPTHGSVGAPVTITGKNFSATVSGNEVKFNGVKATVSSASATQLVTTVPIGASTGKITIKTGDKTAKSSDDFTVANPTITSFSPSSGIPGTQVIITGTNFSTTLADNIVKFNGQLATVTTATATELTLTVPAGATTGKITVTLNSSIAISASDFTVINAPTITSFSPLSGAIGSQVIITGTDFNSTPSSQTVRFNNQEATVTAATATQLTVTVPTGATTGKISITTQGVTVASESDFTVLSFTSLSPTITSFSPSSGAVGTQVIITGTNFNSTPSSQTVKFNNQEATVAAATTTQLTVTVPTGATTGKISITTQGITVTAESDFTVLPPPAVLPPTITSFSPSSGAVGTQVIITGTNFSSSPSSNTVKFSNNITATVTAATSTQLTVTIPGGATTGKISVTTNGLTVNSATDFTIVVPVLTVQSYSPALALPGEVVTITGTGFSLTPNQNQVMFGGNVQATVTSATSTSLTVTVPATATTGPVKVSVGASQVTGATSFEVLKDIPRNGLVQFYPFSGNTQDASGNGFHLIYNFASSPTADRFGLPDKAYRFEGGNDYIYGNNASHGAITQPLTLSAWIKYDELKSSSIFSKYETTGYILSVVSNGAIALYTDHAVYAISDPNIIPANSAGQWIMITVTFDGSTVKFYKDGNLSGTVPLSSQVTANSGTMRLGLSGASSGIGMFTCSIDDVISYNRILSAAEVQQLYSATVSKK